MPKSNVRMINGVEITGTPNVGDIPVATSATAAAWASGAIALAGAVILAPAASTRNVIQSTGNFIELVLKAMTGQTVNVFETRNALNAVTTSVSPDGIATFGYVLPDNINLKYGLTLLAYLATGSVILPSTASGTSPTYVAGSNFGAIGPSGTRTITLPASPSGLYGTGTNNSNRPIILVVDEVGTASTNVITVAAAAGDNINHAASVDINTDFGHVLLIANGAKGWTIVSSGSGGGGGGAGTVTSVDITVPTGLSVTGNPITTSGTLAITWSTQSANRVFAGPTSGGVATPTFRTLVSADIPNNAADTTGKSAKTDALNSASTVVNVSSATAPTTGQVLTATDNTHATWQTPAGGGGFTPDLVIRKQTSGTWITYTGTTAISSAVAASSSGDIVWVGPGTFNDKNFLKNGVNLWFEGSNVVYTGSSNGAIFDDGANGAGGAVTCNIGGFGSFTNSGSGSGNFAVNLDNASTVTISAKLLKSTVTDTCELNAGTLIFSLVDTVSATGSNKAAIYVGSSASLSGRARSIAQTTGSSGFGLYSSGTTSLVCEDISAVGKGVFSDFGILDIDVHTLASSNSIGVHTNGAGTFRVSANAISTGASGTYAVRLSNGTVNLLAKTIVSGGNNAALWLNGATAFISADTISSTSAYEPAVTVDGGISAVAAKTISTTSGSQYAVGGSGGTVRLINCRAKNTGTNGIAALISGGTQIWEGGTLISHSGASDSIYASSAQDMTIYGVVSANKSKNANVTVRVGTLTVDTVYVT